MNCFPIPWKYRKLGKKLFQNNPKSTKENNTYILPYIKKNQGIGGH